MEYHSFVKDDASVFVIFSNGPIPFYFAASLLLNELVIVRIFNSSQENQLWE